MEKNSLHPFTKKLLEINQAFIEFPVQESGQFRDKLPHESLLTEKNMLWTILKENIGKELWSITMPVTFNEPISFLQRINEQLEYQDQLRLANKCMDQYLRLAYVFSHSYMMFTNTVKRVNKTFNPLLGETYEYVNKDLKCIMEQVSHHPPIAAYYAESNDYILTGNFIMNTELKLTSFKMVPTGETTVILKATEEKFSLTKPKSTLYNYMIGKMYVWYEGPMECYNHETKDKLEMVFKKKGWTSSGDYLVDGYIYDADGKEVYKVEGNWKDSLHIFDKSTKELTKICGRKPEPENCEKQYNFTNFAIQSNFLPQEILKSLPPTDSRLRPDMRAYEFGNVKSASEEKHRLEENQRTRRKELKEAKKEWKPLWFDFEINGNDVKTKYKGEYWKYKESGKWPAEILDLYN